MPSRRDIAALAADGRCARDPGARRAGRPDRVGPRAPSTRAIAAGDDLLLDIRLAGRGDPQRARRGARSSARRRRTTACRPSSARGTTGWPRSSAEVDGLETAWAGLGRRVARRQPAVGPAGRRTTRPCSRPPAQGRDADVRRRPSRRSTGADQAITDARTLRDTLARSVDVAVLDEWLDRNAAYDVALRDLYAALDGVGGRVTDDVRDGHRCRAAAKERLPADSRGLILIMSEIGRGGMNAAVIAIEEARGALAEAPRAAAVRRHPSGSPDALLRPAARRYTPAHIRGPDRGPPLVASASATASPEDRRTVQLRVVTDQPWDVKADVLVIPVVGEPGLRGPARRARPPRRRRAPAPRGLPASSPASASPRPSPAPGELPAGRLLTVGIGDPATLDREAVVRVGASAERRLGGRDRPLARRSG